MEETRSQRYCRKCLTREMIGQEEYFQSLHAYIANLEADSKVSDELYEERLTVCKDCEMLFQGMCRVCGCYVELRASMKKMPVPGTAGSGRIRRISDGF